jgi:cyanate permease
MIIPLMAAELFGVKVMGRVMGLVLTVDGLGEAFGPILAGGIRDQTGSYTLGFTALILLSVIGTIAVAVLPRKKIE